MTASAGTAAEPALPAPRRDAVDRFDRRLLLRLLAVAAVLWVYYGHEWRLLQTLWHGAFAAGLTWIGDQPIVDASELALYLGGHRYTLSPGCTYVDLLLVLGVLIWRPDRPVAPNLGRLLALLPILAIVNELRVVAAIHLHAVEGRDWRLTHTWPDWWFHVLLITGASLRAMWTDWRTRRGG